MNVKLSLAMLGGKGEEMPTPLMKSLAKKSGKKLKTIEKMWDKTVELVKSEYELNEDDDRFYPLVVGMLKRLLRLTSDDFEKKVNEDDAVATGDPSMTTQSIGSENGEGAKFYSRIGAPQSFNNPFLTDKEFKSETKKKTKAVLTDEELAAYVKSVVAAMNDPSFQDRKKQNLTELLDRTLAVYDDEDVDFMVERSVLFIGRYVGVIPSIFD